MSVATPTDHPKSFRNRCVIEVFVGSFCRILTLCYRGLFNRDKLVLFFLFKLYFLNPIQRCCHTCNESNMPMGNAYSSGYMLLPFMTCIMYALFVECSLFIKLVIYFTRNIELFSVLLFTCHVYADNRRNVRIKKGTLYTQNHFSKTCARLYEIRNKKTLRLRWIHRFIEL